MKLEPGRKKVPMELGMTRSDKARLWIFGILFVVVLGTFLGLRLYGTSGEPEETRKGGGGGGPGGVIDIARHDLEYRLPVRELDPAWKKVIRDGGFREASRLEAPYWLLLDFAANLGPEGYEALKNAEGFEIASFTGGTERLLRLRDRFRLRFVALEGRIDAVSLEEEVAENPAKIKKRLRATLVMEDGSRVRVDSPRELTDFPADLSAGAVRVEGVFYKRWMHRTEVGEEAELPLVVLTGLYAADEDR